MATSQINEGKSRVEEWRGGLGEALRVAGSFVCRCPSSPPCPGSTPRSSNRTCGFAASGSRTRTHAFAHKRRRGRPSSLISLKVRRRYGSEYRDRLDPCTRSRCPSH
jgi:hypothetical protein